jgi:cobalt-zinc-cadmium efflux system protein
MQSDQNDHSHSPAYHDHHGPSHGLSHVHDHRHGLGHGQTIGFAFFLNLLLSLLEIIGGLWIGSFAIIAGAIHDFGDALSLGLAWYLETLATRKKNAQFNFGYRRFSLLSALVTGVLIFSGSLLICFHAVKDFNTPHFPDPKLMIFFAALGIGVNGFSAWRMSLGRSKNEKILTWHLIQDFLSWFAVLATAILMNYVSWPWLDPLIAILLSVYVAFNVFTHLKSTVYLFLQGRPEDFDEEKFAEEVTKLGGIFKVTNIGIWSLDGHYNILSCRIIFSKNFSVSELEEINKSIRHIASHQGNFEITIEPHYAPDCECAP